MKKTSTWRRQLEGIKPVEAKFRVNDYETCERLTPVPDSYAPNGKPNYIKTIRKRKRIHLKNTYKKDIA